MYFKCKTNIETFFYTQLLVGFTLISCLPYFFSVTSRVVTIPFRALVLFFSLYILYVNLKNKSKVFVSYKQFLCFLLFWLLYLFSVFLCFRNYDFSPQFEKTELEIYLKVVGVNLLPSLALLTINPKKVNYNKVAFFSIIVFFIVFSISLLVGLKYDHHGRTSGILSTYSIDFGHYGATLALLCIHKLLFFKNQIVFRFFFHFGYILGLYIIYASATRGPFVSFLLAFFFLLLLSNKIRMIVYYMLILMAGFILIVIFSPNLDVNNGSAFFYRLSNMILHGDSSGRISIYKKALNEFYENMLFGGKFVFYDGTYAHNLFLDVLMSMGVVGLFLFLLFFKDSLIELRNVINEKKNLFTDKINNKWIHVLFVQYFTFELVSGCLFGMPIFWYLLAMVLVIYSNKYNRVSYV